MRASIPACSATSIKSNRAGMKALLVASFIVAAFLALTWSALARAEIDRDTQPSEALSPEEVVRIQMDAFGANARWGNDAGIELAFRFASPKNRGVTGPLERFVKLLKNPLYAPMLDYQSIEYAPMREKGGQVLVPVLLTGEDGSRAGYMFILGKQAGDACACWMTESVGRVQLGGNGKPKDKGTAI